MDEDVLSQFHFVLEVDIVVYINNIIYVFFVKKKKTYSSFFYINYFKLRTLLKLYKLDINLT